MAEGKKITEKDLPKSLTQGESDKGKEIIFPHSLADMEKRCILAALEAANGNKRKAVKILGISRPTLDKKIKKYALE
jgi:transcriptional regulator of acetoin/glycerol metabolism